MLSVAYLGISILLFWVVLNLEGNSCPEDRIFILKRVLERFGIEKIEALLADREFIGKEWFYFLIQKNIPFIIRGKKNFKVGLEEGISLPVGDLRKHLKRRKLVNCPVNLWGYSLYISVEEPIPVKSFSRLFGIFDSFRATQKLSSMF